jgi:hypothetical protein
MRIPRFVFIVIALAISCVPKIDETMVSDPTIEAERHAVISSDEMGVFERVLLSRRQINSQFIVVDERIGGAFGELEDNNLIKIIPALQQDTFENFIWQKRPPIRPVTFPYEDELAVISRSEVATFFPNAHRYPIFSRVGFSHDRRQALVYYIDNCPALCGYGAYFLLVKTSEGWRIQEESQTFAT